MEKESWPKLEKVKNDKFELETLYQTKKVILTQMLKGKKPELASAYLKRCVMAFATFPEELLRRLFSFYGKKITKEESTANLVPELLKLIRVSSIPELPEKLFTQMNLNL